jgi:hypothetical protein
MTSAVLGSAAAGIDSHLHTNIIGAMLRPRHRTIAVDEAGADEVLHVIPLRTPAHPSIAGSAKLATSAASGPGRADTARTIDGAARATMEIRA